MDGVHRRRVLAVHRKDHIARAQARLRRWAARHDLHDLHAGRHRDAKARRGRLRKRHGLPGEAEIAAHHAPLAHKVGNDALGRIDGHRETGRVGARDDGGVHADDAATGVKQCAARIAGVQSGIGLDDVLDQPAVRGAQASAARR